MELHDLPVALGLSFHKFDLQKNQRAILRLRRNEIVVEYFCRIGMNLRLRQKMKLSWEIFVELE